MKTPISNGWLARNEYEYHISSVVHGKLPYTFKSPWPGVHFTIHEFSSLLSSRQQPGCNCHGLNVQTWLLFQVTWLQCLRVSVCKVLKDPLREEFAERVTIGLENIQEVGVEHFKKCFVNHHPDTQKCIMYGKTHWCPNNQPYPQDKESKELNAWSFKNALTSLFHLYLRILVCIKATNNTILCMSLSNYFQKG